MHLRLRPSSYAGILVFLLHCCGRASAHSGWELPERCDSPEVLCWSKKLRNSLEPGVFTLLVPPPFTHSLGCLSQTDPEFRSSISALFQSVDVSVEAIHAFTLQNYDEIWSLAKTFDVTLGTLHPRIMGGHNFMSMNRSVCHLVYLTGKLLYPFARRWPVAAVVAKLAADGVFDQFWYIMLHWIDIQSTAWPILPLLEFFAAEMRREASSGGGAATADSVFAVDSDRDANFPVEDLLDLCPRSPGVLATRLLLAGSSSGGSGGRCPLAIAAAHFALALALLDGNGDAKHPSAGVAWQVQGLVTEALFWIRATNSADRRLPGGPVLRLLHTSWPVLPLWGCLWRHPAARAALFQPAQECPASPSPIWSLRRLHAEALERELASAIGATSVFEAHVEAAGAGSSAPANVLERREAWATAFAMAPLDGLRPSEALAWLEAVRVLHASVRRHETDGVRRPFLVIVEAGLEAHFAESLRADGMQPVVADPFVIPEDLAECGGVQRRAEGLRFRLFGLTEYQRIVYIDADALVVGPVSHLFAVPQGVFLSATINGTRWTYRRRGEDVAETGNRPAMLNTGVMSIAPRKDYLPAIMKIVALSDWTTDGGGGWAACSSAAVAAARDDAIVQNVCRTHGVFVAFCTQGLIDAVVLAQSRRLGHAVWRDGAFQGCISGEPARGDGDAMGRRLQLALPRPWVDHCTLDEGHNLQVTRPHLGWHMPFLRQLAREGGSVSIVHWPGRPKPWILAPGQRSSWEQHWWAAHDGLCSARDSRGGSCWIRCY